MQASTVKSQHFEKRQKKSKREVKNAHSDSIRRKQPYKRQNDNSIDGTIDWDTTSGDWRRCETMYLTWAGGHGPFNINATSYPDNNSNANGYQGALQWQIAYLVGNHNYQWVARAPPNTTFYFDVEDTSNGERISSYLPIHINDAFAAGLTSCQVDYSNAANTTLIIEGSDTVSISTTSITSSASLSSAAATAIQPASTSSYSNMGTQQGDSISSSSQNSISDKTVKALHAGIAILIIALFAMGLMQYRLRKRLARLQKGHSTVGRWMNHHDLGLGRDGIKEKNATEARGAVRGGRENAQVLRPASSSSNLYAISEAGSSSNFFAHRSASQSGGGSTISRAGSTSTTRLRPSSMSSSATSNPFADNTEPMEDEGDDDIIHRSASQANRYSQAESMISDANTVVTSTSGRLSSIAPSDQVSSIGNASVISDDHYHRAKAFTIARGAGLTGAAGIGGGQFLDPNNLAFFDSRR